MHRYLLIENHRRSVGTPLYARLIRLVGNREMLKMNNWIVRPPGLNNVGGFLY